ncbi:hypothetical protein, partial [Xylophilus sp.]|uniref:hypothetical protein n=1 Tax=Xylophilus sp. TaxID=2653893 RepID=UPI002D7E5354
EGLSHGSMGQPGGPPAAWQGPDRSTARNQFTNRLTHRNTDSPLYVNRGGSGLVPEAGIEPARLSAKDFLTTSTFAAALLNAGVRGLEHAFTIALRP